MPDAAETPADERELVLTRVIDAAPQTLFRCWTEPELLMPWFTPEPWRTVEAELDVRPGGASRIVMRSPEGEEVPNLGVYLEVAPGRRIVFTDAYGAGWVPSAKPFFTGVITFDPVEGGTLYTARARHWTVEDARRHAEMGFHEGWGRCAEQLAAFARTL